MYNTFDYYNPETLEDVDLSQLCPSCGIAAETNNWRTDLLSAQIRREQRRVKSDGVGLARRSPDSGRHRDLTVSDRRGVQRTAGGTAVWRCQTGETFSGQRTAVGAFGQRCPGILPRRNASCYRGTCLVALAWRRVAAAGGVFRRHDA